MAAIKYSFLIGFWLIFLGCTYSPETDFINPIKPPDVESYSISLNNSLDIDTLTIFGPTTFQYSISSGVCDELIRAVVRHQEGSPQHDDMTIVMLHAV